MATTTIDGAKQIKSGSISDTQIASGAAISLTKLAEQVLQADGGQTWTGDQNAGNVKITSLANGVADTDACTVGQARQFAQSKDWKDAVDAATTANVNLASALANGQVIDGVTL